MSQTEEVAKATVDAWNANHPSGARVIYITGDGQQQITQTRSEAWLISPEGEPAIQINGRDGCVPLSRIIPADAKNTPVTVRVFVHQGCCESIYALNPHPNIEIDAEVYDGDGDNGEEYEKAAAEINQDRNWKAIA